MPSAKNGLKKEKDFERIVRTGKRVKEKFLTMKTVENNLKETRFAISVSKKISKKATVRNKIRRRIKSLISQNLPEIKEGLDILLVGLPGLEKQNFSEIKTIVGDLFLKAKILK